MRALLLIICLLLVQLPLTGQAPGAGNQANNKPSREVVKLKRSPKALVMAKAFNDGKLPEPARLPRGTIDQQAAALGKAVSLRDENSMAALYAALLAAGFGVRDADGSVMQTNERGQGILLDGSELAATAKLYGESYGVGLSHLADAFARGIPELKEMQLANVVIEGIRAGANSNNPPVRFLSRFIVELGRNGEPPHDLLGNADPAKIRLDAIQVSLILKRLTGDLLIGEQKSARLKHHAIIPQSLCDTTDKEDLILDFNALASTSLFGILKDKVGGKLGKYGGAAGVANIAATVFKFILTYSLVDVEITMDGDMLERTKSNTTHGDVRMLTAKLKVLPSSWDKLKCVRFILNLAGIDVSLPSAGPLSDTTVQWSLVKGGDSQGIFGSVLDWISGEDERDDIVFLNPKDGKRTADANGVSTIYVVGMSQKEDLSRRKVFELYKASGVNVGVQIKPTKVKEAEAAFSNLMDVVGIIFSFMTGDIVGGGVSLIFETMYRTNWYSSKPFYFMVKDWEPCKGHWQGTITYTSEFKETGSAENLHLTQSWDDETFYRAEAEIPGRRDDQGLQIARVKATAREKKTDISTGKGVCYRSTTQVRELNGSENVTTGFGGVSINPRTRQYTVLAPTILVHANGSESVTSKVQGTCNNPFNKDVNRSSPLTNLTLDADGPTLQGRGTIDPGNPDVISGTDSVTLPTQRGGQRKVTITWNLRKCQDQ
ncbi:MAG TPA: hypothetical protein VFS90_22485 [Pyrinomonadaceae bacterium]|nr:hypothetical protein [Pyrinomonadaceae bacterium]